MKPRYKIWNWYIENQNDQTCKLKGISNHYTEGRMIITSNILKIDFIAGIVETKNSIYELQKGSFPI